MTEPSPQLEMGESIDLDTRVTGGLTITRDKHVEDAYAIDGHGGELSRYEIKRLAEIAGFTVQE